MQGFLSPNWSQMNKIVLEFCKRPISITIFSHVIHLFTALLLMSWSHAQGNFIKYGNMLFGKNKYAES